MMKLVNQQSLTGCVQNQWTASDDSARGVRGISHPLMQSRCFEKVNAAVDLDGMDGGKSLSTQRH